MTLRHRILRRDRIDSATRARMFELMQLCYENVDRGRFEHDLDEKQHVIALFDRDDVLMGFSTIRIAHELLEGKRVDILFSGDTVIHPDCWGAKALQRGFLAFTFKHKLQNPFRPLYWLLLSKGYKTYLLLANNFPTAFPRRQTASVRVAPSPSLVALKHRVAEAWWGREYDASTSLLRFDVARDRVKHNVATIDAETLANEDVAFFVENNPRWADGDELVCMAEIDFMLAFRWFTKQIRRAFAPRALSASTQPAAPRT